MSAEVLADEPIDALESRLFWTMVAIVALTIPVSALMAPWRVTVGLALGGTLSLLNYHWLRTSVMALLNEATVKRPSITITRYLFRYLVIGTTVFALYMLQVISLPAT